MAFPITRDNVVLKQFCRKLVTELAEEVVHTVNESKTVERMIERDPNISEVTLTANNDWLQREYDKMHIVQQGYIINEEDGAVPVLHQFLPGLVITYKNPPFKPLKILSQGDSSLPSIFEGTQSYITTPTVQIMLEFHDAAHSKYDEFESMRRRAGGGVFNLFFSDNNPCADMVIEDFVRCRDRIFNAAMMCGMENKVCVDYCSPNRGNAMDIRERLASLSVSDLVYVAQGLSRVRTQSGRANIIEIPYALVEAMREEGKGPLAGVTR